MYMLRFLFHNAEAFTVTDLANAKKEDKTAT